MGPEFSTWEPYACFPCILLNFGFYANTWSLVPAINGEVGDRSVC